MPIPTALLQRLKKRGIIKNEPQEEIIAESYDADEIITTHQDHPRPQGQQCGQGLGLGPAGQDDPTNVGGAPGCPNKCNPYHLCVEYCWDRWGDGIAEDNIDPQYARRRLRMLAKYPLPVNWRETYDPGTGRYYYWNMDTDEVCWLSPTHPKAQITLAACRLAKSEWEKISMTSSAGKIISSSFSSKDIVGSSNRKRKNKDDSVGAGAGSSESDDNRSDDGESMNRRKAAKKLSIGKSRKLPKDLDPMDPAAYSDIPRGKWSAGLEAKGDAKTGVDSTAVGPLFQQRPYPSPGAILRQNMAEAEKRKRSP